MWMLLMVILHVFHLSVVNDALFSSHDFQDTGRSDQTTVRPIAGGAWGEMSLQAGSTPVIVTLCFCWRSLNRAHLPDRSWAFWLIFFAPTPGVSEELCSTKPWHFQPKHQAVTTVTTSPTPAPTCDLRRHAFHAPWYRWGGPHGELQRQRYPKCSGQTLDAGCGAKAWCNCGKCQKKRLGYPPKMAIYLLFSGFLSLMILAIFWGGTNSLMDFGGYWWVPHFQTHVQKISLRLFLSHWWMIFLGSSYDDFGKCQWDVDFVKMSTNINSFTEIF